MKKLANHRNLSALFFVAIFAAVLGAFAPKLVLAAPPPEDYQKCDTLTPSGVREATFNIFKGDSVTFNPVEVNDALLIKGGDHSFTVGSAEAAMSADATAHYVRMVADGTISSAYYVLSTGQSNSIPMTFNVMGNANATVRVCHTVTQ